MLALLTLTAAVGGLLLFTGLIHLTATLLSRALLALAGVKPNRYRKG